MRGFAYARPESVEAAVDACASRADARYVAGGTNLLDLMKLQVEAPAHLVDIGRIGLDAVREIDGGGLEIGARVTNSDLAAHPLVRSRYPLLAQAILAGASAQLRNRATVAGNLLQRTRCYYFYDRQSPCGRRDQGAGCAAIGGSSRIMAVLGTSDSCIACHPSDMAVAMRALGAVIVTLGPGGAVRRVPLGELHRLPDATPDVENVLGESELITSVELPPPPAGRQLYRKVRDRASYAFALVSVAAAVSVERGRIAEAALAFGGLGTVPWRDQAVERSLMGAAPSPAAFTAAADLLLADARVTIDNAFKVPLARRTLSAVLTELTGTRP